MMLDPKYALIRQFIAFSLLLLLWQAAGWAGMLNPLYMPTPSDIWRALVELFAGGRIWPHIESTFIASLAGLALGIVAGIALGVLAALVPLVS